MEGINYLAVIAAALANFVIGGLWYSPLLFGPAWMRANGFSEEHLKQGSPAVIFGLAFLFSLLMAANLAAFLAGPETTLQFALGASIAAGLGWAALGLAVVALFERRPWSYILSTAAISPFLRAMGLVLGLWR